MFKDKINILLAEDDLNLGVLLVDYLETEGFVVKLCKDGITKPFDEEELLWKIKAVIRRVPESKNEIKQEVISIGKYEFDFNNQSLTISGKTQRITEKESDILNYLSQHRNHIIKREAMLKELWGENDYFLGRSLDVFISKMRRYLKEDSTITIENVFGVGFIFNVPNSSI